MKNYLEFEGFSSAKRLKQSEGGGRQHLSTQLLLHPNGTSGPSALTFLGTSVPSSLACLRRCKPFHPIAIMSWDLETHSSKVGHEIYSWCRSWLEQKHEEEDLLVTAEAWKTLKRQHKSRIQEKQMQDMIHPSKEILGDGGGRGSSLTGLENRSLVRRGHSSRSSESETSHETRFHIRPLK